MNSARTNPAIWLRLCLAAFVALGLLYSVATPIFEAPDESFHFFVIQHIRQTGQLPVQGADEDTAYAQEGSQPPLYYLAGALLTSWIDTRDADTFLRRNPQANLGVPGDPGNKNHFIHTVRETFPWQGTPLAVHLLRLFSIALGAVTMVCAHATARLIAPDRPAVANTAAAFMAFTPQFLFISAAVNNDNAINALAAAAVYLLTRLWRGDRSVRALAALAVVLALATLAKLGGLILLGFAVGAIGYLGVTRHARRWAARAIALVLLAALLIGGWWYVRNYQLYGDVTGLTAMYEVVGQRALTPGELIAELPGLWYSVWGIFGWFNIALPDGLYVAYSALVLAALLSAGVAVTRQMRSRRWPPAAEPLTGLTLYVGLVVLGVLRWTSSTHGSQGRLLFPAASAGAILIAYGLVSLARSDRWTPILAGVMAGIAALIPWTALMPNYARPQSITLSDIPASVVRLNVDFNNTVRLIGGQLETAVARPGDTVTVVLYWQTLRPPDRAYMVYVHLLGRGLELAGNEDAYHGQGTFPTDLWRGDEIMADRFTVRLRPDAIAPALVRVEVGLRDQMVDQSVAVANADGSPHIGLVVVDQLRLVSTTPIDLPSTEARYRLGDAIELSGYDAPQIDRERGVIRYRLYWHVVDSASVLSDDYTVFAHALDAASAPIGQGDSQPFNGDYPTSVWSAGETLVEDRLITLNAGVIPDHITLAIGLYRLSDGARLPVFDAAGQRMRDDQIALTVR